MTGAWVFLALALVALPGCVHALSLHSRDGESWRGKYRFAREDTGLIQVSAPDGEVLRGKFGRVSRAAFVASYAQTFGSGAIAVETPDIPADGSGFAGLFARSNVLVESARGEDFKAGARVTVTGALFYWTASLRGDRGLTMDCYFIGSSYTGHGFGKCKAHTGEEYTAEF